MSQRRCDPYKAMRRAGLPGRLIWEVLCQTYLRMWRECLLVMAAWIGGSVGSVLLLPSLVYAGPVMYTLGLAAFGIVHGALFLVTLLVSTRWCAWPTTWRVLDERGHSLCHYCGYDLRGAAGRCPECGWDKEETP